MPRSESPKKKKRPDECLERRPAVNPRSARSLLSAAWRLARTRLGAAGISLATIVPLAGYVWTPIHDGITGFIDRADADHWKVLGLSARTDGAEARIGELTRKVDEMRRDVDRQGVAVEMLWRGPNPAPGPKRGTLQ